MSKWHSHPIKYRETNQDMKKKDTKQRALTDCQVQREGQVRSLKESQRVRGTHSLSSTEKVTSQDT